MRHKEGVTFCEPIGHRQEDGDYRESWQPQPMNDLALQRSKEIARAVVEDLGGYGIYGVELFVKGENVWFSEVSPRPHDTGLVTLVSQDLSEFAIHARAILGIPVPVVRQNGPSASAVILPEGSSTEVSYTGLEEALAQPGTQLRLFGKPELQGRRRMGVALALGSSIEDAREKARTAASSIKVEF